MLKKFQHDKDITKVSNFDYGLRMASLSRGSLLRLGREVGENLMAETSACPQTTEMP